jgi:protein-tyrosine phosphatase
MVAPHSVDSYWVIRNKFLAGEYPGHWNEEDAFERIAYLLDLGVTAFFDLTEADEGLRSYADLLALEARSRGIEVAYQRFAIPDRTAPSPELATRIVESLETALAQGQVPYMHCYAGIGRTGTIVGIWMVRNRRISGAQAIKEIGRLRRKVRYAEYESPEMPDQISLLRNWPQTR